MNRVLARSVPRWVGGAALTFSALVLAGCGTTQPTPTAAAVSKPATVASPAAAVASPTVPAAAKPTAPSPTATRPATVLLPSPSPTGVGRVAPAGQPTVVLTANPQHGTILTDARGMTLYLFTRDQANVSNCYDQCAQLWPPLLIATGEPMAGPDVPGRLGLHTRRDGSRQVTYNGLPLYYYTPDTQPGDARGQNVGGVWFVVGPNASPSASPSPAR